MVDWSKLSKTADYTTVYQALGGWQSVLVDGADGEPIQTGLGPFGQDHTAAVLDARALAASYGVLCKAELRATARRDRYNRKKRRSP